MATAVGVPPASRCLRIPRLSNRETASLPLLRPKSAPPESAAIAVGALSPPPVSWIAIVNAVGLATTGLNVDVLETPWSRVAHIPRWVLRDIHRCSDGVGRIAPSRMSIGKQTAADALGVLGAESMELMQNSSRPRWC